MVAAGLKGRRYLFQLSLTARPVVRTCRGCRARCGCQLEEVLLPNDKLLPRGL